MVSFLLQCFLLVASFVSVHASVNLPGFPRQIYGVNLGSWLVLESWMLPGEWLQMGGQTGCPCATCIGSEFNFVKAYPDTADDIFNKHWTTWFTQDDVNRLKEYGINTVRIPLGYWIVEPLVDRRTEYFPRGGIKQLRRGLQQLKNAGIAVILDHHAPPGAQAVNQMFAGRCTPTPEFYTPYNYHRALIWTAVMTTLSHIDPVFSTVAAIQAVNEPLMDATMTPGYGEFQKAFVLTVRATEAALGILPFDILSRDTSAGAKNLTSAFRDAANDPAVKDSVASVLLDTIAVLAQMGVDLTSFAINRRSLVTNFMDVNWQRNNPPNPANAALGPQGYDNHLYYSFGGVADPNENAYLTSICNLQRIQNDAALGNSPLWFGEWGLPTQFNATDEFLYKWADAQKLAYSKGAGWLFWNFKIEISPEAGDTARQWSYFEGVRRGYLTKDPSQVHDPHVCAPYINTTSTGNSNTTQTINATPNN